MKSKRIYDEKMNVLKNIDNIAYDDIKDKIYSKNKKNNAFLFSWKQ